MSKPEEPKKQTSKELASALSPVAEAVGVSVSEDRLAPQIDTSLPVSTQARQCGQLLRKTPLFLQGDRLVIVNEDTGECKPMNPTLFVSWAEEYVSFGQHRGEGSGRRFAVKSISTELASKILEAEQFRRELRPLRGVHDVALPTWANPEKTAVRLLPAGYDEETATFTAPAFEYETDMHPEDALNFLRDVYGEFPFDDSDGRKPLEKNRSFSVQMAAHFTAYGRLLFTDCLRPGFVFLANQSGSGKTLLARMALAPVFGTVAPSALSRDENELEKRLTTWTEEGKKYLFFDNVKGGRVSSAALELFLTSPEYEGRILSKNESGGGKNQALVILTGNDVTLSTDLKRRTLLCELFVVGEGLDRKFRNPITDKWVADPETRARFLAALWSLMNNWQTAKCPRIKEGLVPSFETYSEIIGGLVTLNGFANPLETPATQMDESEQAWRQFLRALADPVETGTTYDYRVDDAMQVAEENGLLDALTYGGRDDRKTFGQRIAKWKGRQFEDNQGRSFEFGKRRDGKGSIYPVTVFPASGK